MKKYKGNLRRVFKHNPLGFHPNAMPAALAAECAREQGKFWDIKKKIFENQRKLSKDDLAKYAKEVGLDMGRWNKCFESEKYKDQIVEDQRLAMTLGARGTPAFFINGRFLSGAQPQPRFEALIDEELEKAKKSGKSKDEYYQEVVVAGGKKKM